MKRIFFLVAIILLLGLGIIFAQHAFVSSRIELRQTGTIANGKVDTAIEEFENYGCHEIIVFTVNKTSSNVACLEILIAE